MESSEVEAPLLVTWSAAWQVVAPLLFDLAETLLRISYDASAYR